MFGSTLDFLKYEYYTLCDIIVLYHKSTLSTYRIEYSTVSFKMNHSMHCTHLSRSSDLTFCDYFFCGHIEDIIYVPTIFILSTKEELKVLH